MCKNPLKDWPVGLEGKTWDYGYVKSPEAFIEEVFEIAFGDNAINRDYSMGEVLDRLMEFSNNAYRYEEGEDLCDERGRPL
tara:strand:- start:220 stop:462 length:243 start_codon:yes stop_codon:yes gene_type:complete